MDMNNVCLRDITEIIGGELQLGSLPPLDGEMQSVDRIVTDSRLVQPGDVYWAATKWDDDGAEMAYARGAIGVVVSGHRVEPWAGKFCIQVDDANQALWQFGQWVRDMFSGTFVLVANRADEQDLYHDIHVIAGHDLAGQSYRVSSATSSDLVLALTQLNIRHDYGVFEVSIADDKQLMQVVSQCAPDVIVWPGCAHSAKGWLATSPSAEPTQRAPRQPVTVVLRETPERSQDETVEQDLAELCLTIGQSERSDFRAENVRVENSSLCFSIEHQQFVVPGKTVIDLDRTLFSLAVGRLLGITLPRMHASLREPQRRPANSILAAVHETESLGKTIHSLT